MDFYKKIIRAETNNQSFFGRYIADTDSEHDKGRIYHLHRYNNARDGFAPSIYSSDNRGMGQGGYVNNILAAGTYFEEVTEAEYEAQKLADDAIPTKDYCWTAKDNSSMGADARLGKLVMQLLHMRKIRARWVPEHEIPMSFVKMFGIRVNEDNIEELIEEFNKQNERYLSGELKFYGRY